MAVLLVVVPAACTGQNTDSAVAANPSAGQKSQDKPVPASRPADQDESQSRSDTSSPANVEKAAPRKSSSPRTAIARRKHRSRSQKPAAAPVNESEPRKIVIHRGGASEPVTQIIPGMTLEESNRLRQEAQDLLAAADSDLKKLTIRDLNSSQRETVGQIRHYLDVARSALADGDIQRAHTLAQKAQLLADDLVTH